MSTSIDTLLPGASAAAVQQQHAGPALQPDDDETLNAVLAELSGKPAAPTTAAPRALAPSEPLAALPVPYALQDSNAYGADTYVQQGPGAEHAVLAELTEGALVTAAVLVALSVPVAPMLSARFPALAKVPYHEPIITAVVAGLLFTATRRLLLWRA